MEEVLENPLVSVLMTAYNREKYIGEAIESILSSKYQNFELIIVDDCSIDNTLGIAKCYEIQDKRIKVYNNEKNLGQFKNRNKAASYARGKYIKYADSDDIFYPYTLDVMVNAMEKFPDAGLGFCLTHGACYKPLPYLIEPTKVYYQHFFNGGVLYVGPSGLIIKREIFFEMKCFEEFGMPSDNHLALKIASRYNVVAMTKDLFWWRIHEDQAFQDQSKPQSVLNNWMYIFDLMKKYSPLQNQLNRKIVFNANKIFYRNLVRIVFKDLKPWTAISLLFTRLKVK
jgi:glycosyltransferase involved in cell wall biosynthesis